MWIYEKKLEYPVKIHNCNPQAAKIIISQLGGPDGETGAATRYLNQRYSMPDRKVMGILTDIGNLASELLPAYLDIAAPAIVNRHFSGRILR